MKKSKYKVAFNSIDVFIVIAVLAAAVIGAVDVGHADGLLGISDTAEAIFTVSVKGAESLTSAQITSGAGFFVTGGAYGKIESVTYFPSEEEGKIDMNLSVRAVVTLTPDGYYRIGEIKLASGNIIGFTAAGVDCVGTIGFVTIVAK